MELERKPDFPCQVQGKSPGLFFLPSSIAFYMDIHSQKRRGVGGRVRGYRIEVELGWVSSVLQEGPLKRRKLQLSRPPPPPQQNPERGDPPG